MFTLNESSVVEVLEGIATYVGESVERDYATAALTFDNAKGKGTIRAYDIFPGLAAISYDMELKENVELTIGETPLNPVYFIFCLEGHLEHRFSDSDTMEKIHFQQNVILSSSNTRKDFFIIPGNTPLKLSFIYLFRDSIPKGSKTNAEYLRSSLADIFKDIKDDEPYEYFGHILPKTAKFVKRLISNLQAGIAGRLLIEAAILNILASQLIAQDEEKNLPALNTPLNKEELKKIVALTHYISENLSGELSIDVLKKESGLSPKKLQKGFRHLYGESVSNFIRNVRLESAREMIETKNLSISEVVYNVGLSNRSNFAKNFKKRYGVLPMAYRRSLESGNR